jgi:hypothetical protein
MIKRAKYEAAARILEKAPLPALQAQASVDAGTFMSERSSQELSVLQVLRTRLST